MKKFKYLALSLLVGSLFLTGCTAPTLQNLGLNENNNQNTNANNENNNPLRRTDDDDDDANTFTNQDNTLQVELPIGWRDMAGELNDVATLEVGNIISNGYFMVIMNTPAEIEGFTFEEIDDIFVQDFETGYGETPSTPEDVAFNGFTGTYRTADINYEGDDVHFWLYCLEKDGYICQVYGWCFEDGMDMNEKHIEALIDSLELLS